MITSENQVVVQQTALVDSNDIVSTTVSVAPSSAMPLDIKLVMTQADSLRSQAEQDWKQFYVAGRNATKKTMQDVYTLFYLVFHNSDADKDKILEKMKVKIPESKVRKNTKEAAIFIRYVFAEFDDKQVHVYGRSLEVGFNKRIEPTGFISWVEGHKGEFEGIRAEAVQTDGQPKVELWEMGTSFANGANALSVIEADDWDEDEPCRILIAMPNDDGTASVKDAELTEEQVKAVLTIYAKAVAERNKPQGKKRRSLSAGQKMVRTQLKQELDYQEQLLEEHRFNLSDAITRQHMIDKEQAENQLCLAQAKIVGIKASIKALGASAGKA